MKIEESYQAVYNLYILIQRNENRLEIIVFYGKTINVHDIKGSDKLQNRKSKHKVLRTFQRILQTIVNGIMSAISIQSISCFKDCVCTYNIILYVCMLLWNINTFRACAGFEEKYFDYKKM